MIRKGFFGIYQGKEYEITEDMDNNLMIMTENISEVTSDFEDIYNSGLYTKKIKRSELSEYYFIKPRAEYKGKQFNVSNQQKDSYIQLGTKNVSIAKKLNFDRTDKYYHEKWVPISEVKLTEEKKLIDIN